VLLTDAAPSDRRARTLGRADLTGQLAAAFVATGGGWWFATRGAAGLGILTVVIAVAPVVLLARFTSIRQPA
jgi:hypothetical protein